MLVLLIAARCGGAMTVTASARLRTLLASEKLSLMPCCFDGLTARLVEDAAFNVTFMSGFGVSASRGYPDVQLTSYGEMLNSAQTIVAALRRGTPCIADGDTGYGNALNVKRTVRGYAQVGCAGVMIEDQVSPKRCGHTRVKGVVEFDEAVTRIRAACDARDEFFKVTGSKPVVVARTDANSVAGLDEALRRCAAFREVGADVTFMEAPKTVDEMRRYCATVDGPKLANMLEGGATPILPPSELEDMGYTLAAYPLTLLSASVNAMAAALADLRGGETPPNLTPFPDLCEAVGFDEYWQEDDRYLFK
ncbi:hypothetical protein CTAYLR_002771 [Chrysophaeum taylorii]|uniref:Carboxyvinyl-carboxyphosphonate phosphorylmutase n=1 Tax=Chrysophaeum taylorii TaxID=2483200 RepID=A0AAD7UC34_9STRA|nr:hypothetical protein CTAYLR_002771 [Chrysophaeum taylorii]